MSTTFHGNSPEDPHAIAQRAAQQILHTAGYNRIDVAIVLGSGWKPAADVLCAAATSPVAEHPMADFEGFLPPTAEGHGGTIRLMTIGTTRVMVLLGRTHAYEGHPLWRTVHGVRTAAACGATTVVLTNAAGGILQGMRVGQAVLISDHINMTARTPLVGAEFVNMVDAYSPQARHAVKKLRPDMQEAVYAMMPGPQYETPAEIHMLRTLGAGLVGMSTAYETIACRQANVEVVGISLVTNLAAGVTGQPLDHQEVLQAGHDAAQDMGGLLAELVGELA